MTLAAMVGNVALLNSTILTTTRMPFAMAEDGYLPQTLTRKHSRYGTPWLAIVVSAAIYALLAWQSLAQLISVYIWLRSATTVLTVLSARKLRRTQPALNALVQNSRRPLGTSLRSRRARSDGSRRSARQRPLRPDRRSDRDCCGAAYIWDYAILRAPIRAPRVDRQCSTLDIQLKCISKESA